MCSSAFFGIASWGTAFSITAFFLYRPLHFWRRLGRGHGSFFSLPLGRRRGFNPALATGAWGKKVRYGQVIAVRGNAPQVIEELVVASW